MPSAPEDDRRCAGKKLLNVVDAVADAEHHPCIESGLQGQFAKGPHRRGRFIGCRVEAPIGRIDPRHQQSDPPVIAASVPSAVVAST
jgi:hypothetical protein